MADEDAPDVSGDAHGESPTKKPFEPPRLTVYGDITTLTRTVGRTGLSDGGKGTNNRTRL
jgi:hypothetical protein